MNFAPIRIGRNDDLRWELSWLFTNIYMKVKRMGLTEILRRIWVFSANKIKSSESGGKQPTQLILKLNSSLRHIIVTLNKKLPETEKPYLEYYIHGYH